jgi:hypothetical protein
MEGLTEGRIVHYVMQNGQHRPAIVVRAWHNDKLQLTDEGLCNLVVFVDGTNDVKRSFDDPLAKEPVLTMWETSRSYSEEPEPFTWHWIEKA